MCHEKLQPFWRLAIMKVTDILRVKGNTLYTAAPDEPLAGAVELMAERDIGSLGGMGAGLICTLETDMDEVRRMMLERHARYMPVMEQKMLMGVISFYDVAKAVVDSQNFENNMLKAYIRDWPEEN